MKQLFEVGERVRRVRLESKSNPQYNGEYTVEQVYAPETLMPCKVGRGFYTAPTFSYCLGFSYEWMNGVCDTWQQTALRKIHKPSEFTYDKLMNSLKSPVLVNEQ